MPIDWTTLTNPGTYSGTAEYRVDADGVVRLRGTITMLVNGTSRGGAGVLISIPTAARAVNDPTYIDWTTQTTDLNALYNVGLLNVGVYNYAGFGANLSTIAWQGTAPAPVYSTHTLNNILNGLATAVDTVAGLRVYAYPADQVAPPAAVVGVPETPFDVTFGGTTEWRVPVWIVVGKVSDRASRTALAAYVDPLGASSVKAAIEADRTLGGACDSVAVTGAEFTTFSVAGTEYLAAELTTEVVG